MNTTPPNPETPNPTSATESPTTGDDDLAIPDDDPAIPDDDPAIPAESVWFKRVHWIAVAIAVIVLVVLLVPRLVSTVQPHLYSGTVFQDSQPAPPLDGLNFSDGQPVDLVAQQGKMVVVFFGYTHCPDVCPTTLSALSTAMTELGDRADQVEVWMVSVDSDRDDPEELEEYVDHFSPSFSGLSGDQVAIDTVTAQYGVFYQLGEPDSAGDYLVDHTASVIGISPDGSLRILWAPDTKAEAIADDIRALLP